MCGIAIQNSVYLTFRKPISNKWHFANLFSFPELDRMVLRGLIVLTKCDEEPLLVLQLGTGKSVKSLTEITFSYRSLMESTIYSTSPQLREEFRPRIRRNPFLFINSLCSCEQKYSLFNSSFIYTFQETRNDNIAVP